MKPITAACFLAAGAVLALDGRIPHRAVQGLGWLLSVLGAFAIAQDLTGFAPWLWDLLAPRGTLPGAGSQHFSMSTSTAVAFTLAGVALAQRRGPLVPITGSLVGVIAAVALLGYAFGSGELYSLPGFESISLPTALCLLILSVGILFRPDLEWPRISLKTALGTLVSAALLPAVVFMLAQAQRASVEQTTTLERDGRALADKVAILVDRIVAERSALLKALATSPAFEKPGPRPFLRSRQGCGRSRRGLDSCYRSIVPDFAQHSATLWRSTTAHRRDRSSTTRVRYGRVADFGRVPFTAQPTASGLPRLTRGRH